MLDLINKHLKSSSISYSIDDSRYFNVHFHMGYFNGTSNTLYYTTSYSGTYYTTTERPGASDNSNMVLGPGTYITHSGVTIVVP